MTKNENENNPTLSPYRTQDDARNARTLIRKAVAENRITMEQLAKAVGLSSHHCYTLISTAQNHNVISHHTWARLDQMIKEINKCQASQSTLPTKKKSNSKTATMGQITNL